MRLATITNWAYGATVLLTLGSGATMLLASSAQQREQKAVALRYALDHATSTLGEDLYALTGQVRQFVITGDPTHVLVYRRETEAIGKIESRVGQVKDVGASASEIKALEDALRWGDTLQDEQRAAIAARQRGDAERARQIMFGAEYERELTHAEDLLERFQYQLDQRIETEVKTAAAIARTWRTTSEAVLGITGLLFLCVLYFIFKKRVLSPVVRLSDVVTRLAAQDYDVEAPNYEQIDEIGDMALAIRVFRENGIERQRLEEERRVDGLMRDMLARMTQRMQGCDTIGDLEEVVKCFVPEIVPGLAGSLYLLDGGRNAMVQSCSWLSPIRSRSEFSPLACWALRRGTPHRPGGACVDIPCDHLIVDGSPLADTICLPLTAQRETLGLLYFEPRGDTGTNHGPPPEVYLDMLAENIGLALANLRLRDALRAGAVTDALTGLANRRALDDILARQLAETEKHDAPLSCLMLDIDHFKRFNDDHGHDAGDMVLRAVGTALIHATREDGLAFRYGGEEFLLLMPGLDWEQALERAEAIRTTIASLAVNHDGRPLGTITTSIGLACAPSLCARDRLVQAADSALLRAKAAGRDRVVITQARSTTKKAG